MNDKKWILLFIAWTISAFSTLGSLFFSEVMKLPPCILCWYQRIFMYPLVLTLLMGLFPFERKVIKFSLPLVIVGWGIAVYHNLLYYKILPESASPCVQGISCTTVQLNWLGFITIPFLSLAGFTLILSLLILLQRKLMHEK
jgi:disulfide bond formation protein DsbB